LSKSTNGEPMSKSYRFQCRNPQCRAEFHRYYPKQEFEHHQYNTASGWACFNCGYPKMMVMFSNKEVKDTFQAGWQQNIREYCETYSDYKKKLKAKGLIEIGYEELPPNEGDKPYQWSEDMIKKAIKNGLVSPSDGVLIDMMRKGEL